MSRIRAARGAAARERHAAAPPPPPRAHALCLRYRRFAPGVNSGDDDNDVKKEGTRFRSSRVGLDRVLLPPPGPVFSRCQKGKKKKNLRIPPRREPQRGGDRRRLNGGTERCEAASFARSDR
ncbi:hypothetical protein EYF80_034910 [Liparis tanakae]|uniref:Uncharacterized protein n=1 Tax=Liparis tanakae TaxID=230148 RepID=A0A4Z2GNT4_9TELE|nr:hypothetical protein EYF80_034910 [Liparis tanakae]